MNEIRSSDLKKVGVDRGNDQVYRINYPPGLAVITHRYRNVPVVQEESDTDDRNR